MLWVMWTALKVQSLITVQCVTTIGSHKLSTSGKTVTKLIEKLGELVSLLLAHAHSIFFNPRAIAEFLNCFGDGFTLFGTFSSIENQSLYLVTQI